MNALNQRFTPAVSAAALVATSGSGMALALPGNLSGIGRGFVLRDVVATAFLRWRLMLLVMLLPLVAGVAGGLLTQDRYTAEALMIVAISRESAGNTDIGGYGPSILSIDAPKAVLSEINIMTSDGVARDALARVGVDRLYPTLAKGRLFGLLPPLPEAERLNRASEMLRRNLAADVVTNTNTLRVQFYFRDRVLALEVLNALIDAYFTRRRAIFTDSSVTFLSAEVKREEADLQTIEQQMAAIKAKLNVLDIDQSVHLAAARLDGIVQRQDKLREQQQAAQAQIASTRARLSSQPDRVFASSEVTNQSPNDDSRNLLLRLQQEREHLVSQYQPGYPALIELDRKIAAARATVQQNQATNYFTNRETRNPTVELLSSKLAQLQVEGDALTKQLDEVARQRSDAETNAMALLVAQTDLHSLGRHRDALDAVYHQFATREAAARLDDEAHESGGAAVHLVQEPTAPLTGRSMTLSFILAGMCMALLCGVAAAMVLTGLRRIFLSSGEVERGLQLPVLASFPLRGKPFDLAAVNPAVADMAALLLDLAPNAGLGHNVQVIQLVATDAGDGRERLARALAVELAHMHNQRVLLCDLSSDGRAHLAELGVAPAHVQPSNGGIDAFGTIIPRLWITYGAQQSVLANPRALQAQVAPILGQLRQAFDVILLIGPTVIETYAQRRLATLVDANLVVVRAERTEGKQAWLLRETILASGGNLLGAVFTGQREVIPAMLRRAMA